MRLDVLAAPLFAVMLRSTPGFMPAKPDPKGNLVMSVVDQTVRADLAGPVGRTVAEQIAAGRADPEERAEFERLAAFEELARMVILRRAALGLSQADVARRMGTSPSVVSRIESGQHPTNTATLKRVAEALEGRALLGFDFALGSTGGQDLVRL